MTHPPPLPDAVDPWAGTDDPDTALVEEMMPTVVASPYANRNLFDAIPAPRPPADDAAPPRPLTRRQQLAAAWRRGRAGHWK